MPLDSSNKNSRFLLSGGTENQVVVKSSSTEYDYTLLDGVIVDESVIFGGDSGELNERLNSLANIINNFSTNQSLVNGGINNFVEISRTDVNGKSVVLAGLNNAGIWNSFDNGLTFIPSNSYAGIPNDLSVISLYFDANNKGIAYALLGDEGGTYYGIAKSNDFGQSFDTVLLTSGSSVLVGKIKSGSTMGTNWTISTTTGPGSLGVRQSQTGNSYPRAYGPGVADINSHVVAASDAGLIELFASDFDYYNSKLVGHSISSVVNSDKIPELWFASVYNNILNASNGNIVNPYLGVGVVAGDGVDISINNNFGDVHSLRIVEHNNRIYVIVAAGYEGVYYYKVPYGVVGAVNGTTVTLNIDKGDAFDASNGACVVEKSDGSLIRTTYTATLANVNDYDEQQINITMTSPPEVDDKIYGINHQLITLDRNWRKLIGPGGPAEEKRLLVGKLYIISITTI